ncbi:MULTISPECIES: hypothetical protein [Niastella]|uniref:Uncharacterized protein n=1 Tax=Niastella soli TaxID=2821487 RepID=A0ABS3YXD4_9BACT|nr:hypothetical protein [Niastella soli]MBO9202533.1 hypothetical protein [Niastella soli]
MQHTEKSLQRKLNFLFYYAIISSSLFLAFILTSFSGKDKNASMDELTVKKINLTGEDGSLRMVISNETRQHSGRINGQNLSQRPRPAGIIFFNNKGDECGGIVAEVSKDKNALNSGMSFTMDNYHDDQVIQILNDETYENGAASIQRGIIVREFPVGSDMLSRNKQFEELQKIKDEKEREEKMNALWDKDGAKKRLFVGRTAKNDSGLFLYDSNGKPKMKIYVDKNGDPKIEVLDDKGNIRNIVQQ